MTDRSHLVFVYGTLRMNEVNHHLLQKAELVAEQCRTNGKLYDTGLGYPVIVKDEHAMVTGELYFVSNMELEKLDVLEGYSVHGHSNLYERITQTIEVGSQSMKAYVYVNASLIVSEEGRIDSGDWKMYRSGYKSSHKLVLQNTWDRALSDQDRGLIHEIFQCSPVPPEGMISFTPIRAGINYQGNLYATVLIQNGRLNNLEIEQLQLLFQENGINVAEETFTINELLVLANTSTPWTFIFQKENVMKSKLCFDVWSIIVK